MKLISDTTFGLECKAKEKEFTRRIDYLDWYERVRNNFSNFLKQPLTLGMFVPCDEEDNVLKELDSIGVGNEFFFQRALDVYYEAKEKVLFEGFEVIEISKNLIIVKNQNKDCQVFANQVGNIYYKCNGFDIIEDLIKYDLTLTEIAIKKIQ